MANAKLLLDKRYVKKDGTYPLCIQLTHKAKTRFIPLNLNLAIDQWDESTNSVKNHTNTKRETGRVQKRLADTIYYINNNEARIKNLDINSLKKIIETEIFKVKEGDSSDDESIKLKSGKLKEYGDILIQRLEKTNDPSKIKTSIWYRNSVASILKFNNGDDIEMIKIDVAFLEDYKSYFIRTLKQTKEGEKKKSLNSLNCYLRGIRAILNKARSEKRKDGNFYLDKNHKPFESVKIPSQKAGKKGMPKNDINIIRDAVIPVGSTLWHQRNYFLFMFNLKGMNWVDIAHLKRHQVSVGILTYYRSKTRKTKEFRIKLTAEANEILRYYLVGKKADDYVFPILTKELEKDAVTLVKVRDQALHLFNEYMKDFATNLGLEVKPTSYTVRHSWSKIAKSLGVSTDEIKDSLGHEDFKTTEIYLDDLEDIVLDDVNDKVTAR